MIQGNQQKVKVAMMAMMYFEAEMKEVSRFLVFWKFEENFRMSNSLAEELRNFGDYLEHRLKVQATMLSLKQMLNFKAQVATY